jgi:hypothetical protein
MKLLLPPLLALLLAPLHAGVTPGTSTSQGNVSVSGSIADLSVAESFSATGGHRFLFSNSGMLYNDPSGIDYLAVSYSYQLSNNHSVIHPNPDYLQVLGDGKSSIGTHVHASAVQGDPFLRGTSAINSTSPGNESIFTFTVSDDPIDATFTGSIAGSRPDGATLSLQFLHPLDGWQTVLSPTPAASATSFSLQATLQPGSYRLISAAALPSSQLNSTSVTFNYNLSIGIAPVDPAQLIPGEYTHPAAGTVFTDSPLLTPHAPAILHEADLGNGTTAVQVRAGLQNTSKSPWSETRLTLATTAPGGPDITVADGLSLLENSSLEFTHIPAESTANPDDPADKITAIVPNSGLVAFRASILDGSRFQTEGRELWVFLYPPELVGNEYAEELSSKLITPIFPSPVIDTLIFSGVPSLQPGRYYLESEELDPIQTIHVPPVGGVFDPSTGGQLLQGFDRYLPFLVKRVQETNHPEAGRQIEVVIERLSFLQTIKHGTVRSTVDLQHPSGLLVTEGSFGDVVPKPQPIHFNRITIADAIDLSGTLLFDPGPIHVELEMRDLVPETFLVTANFSADATLLVETKDAADNTGQPVLDQEETLCSFPLFTLALPAGITLSPIFSMDVGAAVNAPRGLSVPIQSSAEINITAGMKNGVAYYDSSSSTVPPKISTPALHQQLQAGVEAWVKAQLNCRVGLPGGAIGVGPTLGAKIGGNFQLAPLGDPWWSTQGELSLLAGVEFDLAGLVTLYDAEKEIANLPLFEFDSGGPLLPPFSSRSINLPDNPGIRPVGGDATRWARALRPTSATSPGSFDHFIHPLTGSDDFIAGGGNDVSRYGPDGELKWVLNIGENRRSVPNSDGGFTLLRGNFDRNLARFDGDGNRLWSVIYRTPTGEVSPTDLVVRTVAGQPQYFTAGWTRTNLDNTKPALLKHDHNGNLLWSKVYQPVPVGGENAATDIQRALVTNDGHVVMIGMTGADIASGTTLTNSPNFSFNGFAMKVHGDTGAVLWTTIIAIRNIGSLRALAEGPDGSLYLGGGQQPGVFDGVPALFVTKLHADGSLIDSVLIGPATPAAVQATGYTASSVPHNGGSAFDLIHAMTWADGSLWIAGKIGSPGISIVTDGQSAFTARLTPELGVTRFAIHAGASADFIGAIAPGGDGLLACGWTRSFLPWPAGAANENAPSPVARLVMKLPWEGLLRFHEFSNGKQPAADDPAPVRGSHYVYPRIIAASDTTLFRATLPPDPIDLDAPPVHLAGDALPFTVSDLVLIPGFFPPAAPAKITPLAHHQIEFVPSEVIDGFASYQDYYQTDTTADSDNDGLNLATEFYHGTNPLVSNSVSLRMTTHPLTGAPTLSFPRSELAAAEGWTAPIQKSGTLELWEPVPAGNLDAFPNSSGELLYLNPFIIPGQQKQFYRLIPAQAP